MRLSLLAPLTLATIVCARHRIDSRPLKKQALVRLDGCAWENDPVTCVRTGQRPRTFSSICFAIRAGFYLQDCTSSGGVATDVLRCSTVADLVCGPSNSPHANLCTAQINGFAERDCVKRTSIVHRITEEAEDPKDDNVFCFQIWIPVYCTLRGIQFSNLCEAGSDGYSPEDCTVPKDGSCPKTVSNPVTCLGNVTYSNVCLASEAGHTPSRDCVDSEARVYAKSAKCSRKARQPVQCGKKNQQYDNFCFARAAGFKRKKCKVVTSRHRA